MNKLVVLADLGTFRAFRLDEDPLNSSPRLEPVDSLKLAEGDDRIGQRVSDQAGAFKKNSPMAAAVSDQASGERHNICLEDERRSVKKIASRISDLLSDGKYDECYFAASSEINQTVLDELPPRARQKIHKNIERNLVNAEREEILEHLCN